MLTTDEVEKAMNAAIERAAAIGVPVAVAIVDDGGYLQGVLRNDTSMRIGPDIAISKAYAAAILRRSTAALEGTVSPEILNGRRYMGVYPMLVVGGGIPLLRDGTLVGAIGVGGTKSEQCIDCAETAIAAIGLQAGA